MAPVTPSALAIATPPPPHVAGTPTPATTPPSPRHSSASVPAQALARLADSVTGSVPLGRGPVVLWSKSTIYARLVVIHSVRLLLVCLLFLCPGIYFRGDEKANVWDT